MTSKDDVKIFRLSPCDELRVEIKFSSQVVQVELLEGSAEIFGVNMIQNISRTFEYSFAVFARLGCILKLTGSPHTLKFNLLNPVIYDLHMHLQKYRNKARRNGELGPIVLIAGPTDVGKSTLTRSLLNYAARTGSQPLYIDLDVGQSSVSIPGTVGILPIDTPGDLVKGFYDKKLSAYFFGYKSPSFNILLYFLFISKLSKSMFSRLNSSPTVRSSGAVIDTCGWVDGQGYRSVIHAAKSFCVTHLVVLGNRNLYNRCQNDLPQSTEIIFLDRLDGVVVRNKGFRTSRRNKLLHEYFYGSEVPLSPYVFDIRYSDINIIKIGCVSGKVSEDMYEEPDKYVALEKVPLEPQIISQVLGISYADSIERVVTTSVFGFVCVKNVDLENEILSIISPQPGPLPGKFLVMGDITFNQEYAVK